MSNPQLPFKRSPLDLVRVRAGLSALCLFGVACQHAHPPAAEPPASQQQNDDPSAAKPLPSVKPTPQAPASTGPRPADLKQVAAPFHEFFLHDECTGPFAPQPDTCAHARLHEKAFTFGGDAGTVYDVTLRVRGIFEPTTIEGGTTPDPQHPYFVVGGNVKTLD